MKWWYDKFPSKPHWLIDFAVAYANGNLRDVHFLVEFGYALIMEEAQYQSTRQGKEEKDVGGDSRSTQSTGGEGV